jgi:hypothetical protein
MKICLGVGRIINLVLDGSSELLHAELTLHLMAGLHMMLEGIHGHPGIYGKETNSYRVTNPGLQNSSLSAGQNVSWFP